MFKPIIINGNSMAPALKDKDWILADFKSGIFKEIKQNDIVIIKYKKEYLIKRVIGSEGDFIHFENGKVFVNGKKESVKTVGKTEGTDTYVPKNSVFVLGDNRNTSKDSRILGAIPLKCVKGKYIEKLSPLKIRNQKPTFCSQNFQTLYTQIWNKLNF